MNVRKLMPWEVADVAPLAQAFHDEQMQGQSTFSPEALSVFLVNTDSCVFGVFKDNQLVGALIGFVAPHPMAHGTMAQEILWYVKPEHRGSVESMVLFSKFEAWAKTRGAKAVAMFTSPSTPDGHAIETAYKAHGYSFAGKHFIKFIQ